MCVNVGTSGVKYGLQPVASGRNCSHYGLYIPDFFVYEIQEIFRFFKPDGKIVLPVIFRKPPHAFHKCPSTFPALVLIYLLRWDYQRHKSQSFYYSRPTAFSPHRKSATCKTVQNLNYDRLHTLYVSVATFSKIVCRTAFCQSQKAYFVMFKTDLAYLNELKTAK